MPREVGYQEGAGYDLTFVLDRASKGTRPSKGNTISEETTYSVQSVFADVLMFGFYAGMVRCIKGVNACFLPQGDVLTQILGLNGDIEGARPGLPPKDAMELFLIVWLSHEHMRPSKPAAHDARQVHVHSHDFPFMRLRSSPPALI